LGGREIGGSEIGEREKSKWQKIKRMQHVGFADECDIDVK
jgi:hypothetical protein